MDKPSKLNERLIEHAGDSGTDARFDYREADGVPGLGSYKPGACCRSGPRGSQNQRRSGLFDQPIDSAAARPNRWQIYVVGIAHLDHQVREHAARTIRVGPYRQDLEGEETSP